MHSIPPDPSLLAPVDLSARYRSPRRLAKVVTAVFVLYVGMLAMVALLLWDFLDLANMEIAGYAVSDDALNALVAREAELQFVGIALIVLCVVSFSMWTYRVAKNVVDTGGTLSTTPGLAVGYYFVPILGMWRPYLALAEVWDASDPDRRRLTSAHGCMLTWWFFWIASRIAGSVSTGMTDPTTLEGWVTQIQFSLLSLAMDAIAAGLALAVVWQLTHRQELRATTAPVARVV